MSVNRRAFLQAIGIAPFALIAVPGAALPTGPEIGGKKWDNGVPYFTGFKPSQSTPSWVGQWLLSYSQHDTPRDPERMFFYCNVPGTVRGGSSYLPGAEFDISDAFDAPLSPKTSSAELESLLVEGLYRLAAVVEQHGWKNGVRYVPRSVVARIPTFKLPKQFLDLHANKKLFWSAV